MNCAIVKSDAEWKSQLSPEQYQVTPEGTERAFTGAYHDHHAAGVYRCVCCGALCSVRMRSSIPAPAPSFWKPADTNT
jgi:peptide-methionine (R)-S-oxide reductase